MNVLENPSDKNILAAPEDAYFDFQKLERPRKIKMYFLAGVLFVAFLIAAFFTIKLVLAKVSNSKTVVSDPLVTKKNEQTKTLNDQTKIQNELIVPTVSVTSENNTQDESTEPIIVETPNETPNENSVETPVETPVVAPIEAPAETQAQWTQYTNSEYGYTIKYPTEWASKISNKASVKFMDPNYAWLISKANPELQADEEFIIMNSDINIAVFTAGNTTLEQLVIQNSFMSNVKAIKFANYDAYIGISNNLKRNQIVIKKDSKFYILNFSDDQNTNPISTVLSSFAFTK